MKRSLQFRVWDIQAQNMIYPDKGYQGHYVLYLNGEFANLQNGMGGREVVVQQFTGLTDKNGKKVYEGDFLKFSCDYTFPCGDPDIIEWKNQEVFYDEEKACFFFGRKHEFQILDKIMPKTLEVTGNIFQNPEMVGTDE